jgi:hypothetical protein
MNPTDQGVQNSDANTNPTAPVETLNSNPDNLSPEIEQNDANLSQDDNGNPIVDALQKSKTAEGTNVPYTRFEQVNNAKKQAEQKLDEAMREIEQLRSGQAQQPVRKSSSNNSVIDPEIAPLYEGLPDVEFDNDFVYDEQGNLVQEGQPYPSKRDMYMDFEQRFLKRLGLIDKNQTTKQQTALEQEQKQIALDVQTVKESFMSEIKDENAYGEFADWASKKLGNPNNKLSIPELYELWKDDIYKPKRQYNRQNNGAQNINTPNGGGSSKEPSIEELRASGLQAARLN